MNPSLPKCIECAVEMLDGRHNRKFCSTRCKARWWKKNPHSEPVTHHDCRSCGKRFPIGKGQNNKWLCSDECRRANNAKSVREFHLRRPLMEKVYRAKTKEKMHPDNSSVRFYRDNPLAPKCCQSCGEDRVVEIAHRPGHERIGARKTTANCKWPEMVWVLCPTCHRLLDRMGYSPQELGLS